SIHGSADLDTEVDLDGASGRFTVTSTGAAEDYGFSFDLETVNGDRQGPGQPSEHEAGKGGKLQIPLISSSGTFNPSTTAAPGSIPTTCRPPARSIPTRSRRRRASSPRNPIAPIPASSPTATPRPIPAARPPGTTPRTRPATQPRPGPCT